MFPVVFINFIGDNDWLGNELCDEIRFFPVLLPCRKPAYCYSVCIFHVVDIILVGHRGNSI